MRDKVAFGFFGDAKQVEYRKRLILILRFILAGHHVGTTVNTSARPPCCIIAKSYVLNH
jgi:hypothetical protein